MESWVEIDPMLHESSASAADLLSDLGRLGSLLEGSNGEAGDLIAALESQVAHTEEDRFEVLGRWIQVPEARQAVEPQAAGAPEAADDEASGLPELPGVDTGSGLARVGGKAGVYRKILGQFASRQADAPERIRSALREHDLSMAEREAHTLKGVAGNIGAGEVEAPKLKKYRIGIVLIVLTLTLSTVQGAPPEPPDIGLVADPAPEEATNEYRRGSHVKLFLPNLPYLAISHAINASLVRPANNDKGWRYDLAVSHRNVDDRIWEFHLRKGVHFQDGSPFNADSVLLNMDYFRKQPFTFTKLRKIFDRVEKVDDYTVRFHLTEPYGVFLHDANWLQFYTREYLERHGWNGKPTCPNLAEPGPYALGPYILHEGYVEGDRSTPEVVLKANPQYWGDHKPKVETITIYTDLTISEARDRALFSEGGIDITPVPFADAVEAVLSPYAKLAVSPSMNNYAMHFNMLNGNPAILDERIRYVINHAIDQEYLLNLSMLGQGVLSPTTVSPNFYKVADAIRSLEVYFAQYEQTHDSGAERLRSLVQRYQRENGLDPGQPLRLTLLVQESFLFLIRDIQYFLEQVNIDLKARVVSSEKQVFRQLFDTLEDKNEKPWDLLLWGNYDWYKHPWAAFFVYLPGTSWSTIPPNPELLEFTERLLRTNVASDEYVPLLADFIRFVYEHNYMVFLPNPHNVYAVNKEVVFKPGRSAFVYLRDLQVTDQHWSLRGERPYPPERRKPRRISRQYIEEPSQ